MGSRCGGVHGKGGGGGGGRGGGAEGCLLGMGCRLAALDKQTRDKCRVCPLPQNTLFLITFLSLSLSAPYPSSVETSRSLERLQILVHACSSSLVGRERQRQRERDRERDRVVVTCTYVAGKGEEELKHEVILRRWLTARTQ